jgi:hypothetical protein
VVYHLRKALKLHSSVDHLRAYDLLVERQCLLPKSEPEYMHYRSLGRVSEDGRYKLDEVLEGVTVFGFHPVDLTELAYQAGWKAEEKLGSPVQDLKLAGSVVLVEQGPHDPGYNFTLPRLKESNDHFRTWIGHTVIHLHLNSGSIIQISDYTSSCGRRTWRRLHPRW